MSEEATPGPYADPLKFGQRVQILRERRGMTQAQLADLIDISPHTLRKCQTWTSKATGCPPWAPLSPVCQLLPRRALSDGSPPRFRLRRGAGWG